MNNLPSSLPGYYLSEMNNLQLWYPKNYFLEGYTTLEVYDNELKCFKMYHYDDLLLRMVEATFDFTFIGTL